MLKKKKIWTCSDILSLKTELPGAHKRGTTQNFDDPDPHSEDNTGAITWQPCALATGSPQLPAQDRGILGARSSLALLLAPSLCSGSNHPVPWFLLWLQFQLSPVHLNLLPEAYKSPLQAGDTAHTPHIFFFYNSSAFKILFLNLTIQFPTTFYQTSVFLQQMHILLSPVLPSSPFQPRYFGEINLSLWTGEWMNQWVNQSVTRCLSPLFSNVPNTIKMAIMLRVTYFKHNWAALSGSESVDCSPKPFFPPSSFCRREFKYHSSYFIY